uniref:ARAD1D11858p n=1 Tax=Blastobotrys adeninivorans TaxID=409370 RepID=A0A060T912_BLAAD
MLRCRSVVCSRIPRISLCQASPHTGTTQPRKDNLIRFHRKTISTHQRQSTKTPKFNNTPAYDISRKGSKLRSQHNRILDAIKSTRSTQDQMALVLIPLLGSGLFDSLPRDVLVEIMAPRLRKYPHRKAYFQTLFEKGELLIGLQGKIYEMGLLSQDRAKVNGLNFDAIVQSSHLITQETLLKFANHNQLGSGLISYAPGDIPANDFDQELVNVLMMLIGLVSEQAGVEVASRLVQDRIIRGRNGLYMLATQHSKHSFSEDDN